MGMLGKHSAQRSPSPSQIRPSGNREQLVNAQRLLLCRTTCVRARMAMTSSGKAFAACSAHAKIMPGNMVSLPGPIPYSRLPSPDED